jgi:hypothetical protein
MRMISLWGIRLQTVSVVLTVYRYESEENDVCTTEITTPGAKGISNTRVYPFFATLRVTSSGIFIPRE